MVSLPETFLSTCGFVYATSPDGYGGGSRLAVGRLDRRAGGVLLFFRQEYSARNNGTEDASE
jgi:hypothetical protein